MKKIIAFSASNSSKSINKHLLLGAIKLMDSENVEVLDLRNYDLPIYGLDLEEEQGIPALAKELKSQLITADGFIIATPEHNSSVSTFFKNLYDWMSRSDPRYLAQKPVLLLSTSPGKRGGARGIEVMGKLIGYADGRVVAKYSLPSFNSLFDTESGQVVDEEKLKELKEVLAEFKTC